MKSKKELRAYHQFLAQKQHVNSQLGFDPISVPDWLFPFQKHLVEWAIRKGRCSLFEDCGLGKTPQQLVWADNVVQKTNKPVLILTPLAVALQTVKEGSKFGIECKQTRNGKVYKGINVTNYERLIKYDPNDFAGLVADESSILKGIDSKTRKAVTDFAAKVKYILLATATPSPNDHMELGGSAEALGVMNRSQMLATFFTNGGDSTQKWELKGHARKRFWQWVSMWARALRRPSDLGFDDDGFILPTLTVNQHEVESKRATDGFWPKLAKTLDEQRKERKDTIQSRCEKVASLVTGKDYSVVWCHLNPEGDLLQKLIPGSVNVQGSDKDTVKEEKLTAFSNGEIKVLITKPRIGGFGLNWQHCNHMTFFPSHSHEMYYQAVRRCWRFGQKRKVTVDMVTSEAEKLVVSNMKRKEKQADDLFGSLIVEMNVFQNKPEVDIASMKVEVPSWLQ